MRILIAPVEVSGIAAGLKAGFDRIGVEAELAFSQPHPFGYGASASPRRLLAIWSRLGGACFSAEASRPARIALLVVWKAWSFLVLAWALRRFDGFIFIIGNTITNSRVEAWLHRKLGKKVVIVYCGSDVRPPYIDGQVFWNSAVNAPETVARIAGKISKRVALHERSGFICVNSPFTAHFQARPFVSWFAMGIPRAIEVRAAAEGSSPASGGPIRILHSPSNPPVKGTARISEVVEELKRRGHEVELALLLNVPNDQVLDALATADIVLDQIYSDTPMAGFAVEAAHCGRAILVAGYAATDDLGERICAAPPPTLFVHPDDLETAAERLVADERFRADLGRKARAFVNAEWSAEAVAARYLRLLRGDAPPEWLIDPKTVFYLDGGGLDDSNARAFVGALIRTCGTAALRLDHNPALREAFVAFASPAAADPAP